jgi:hypothetical protein
MAEEAAVWRGKGESLDCSQLLLALGQLEGQITAAKPQSVTYERTPMKRRTPEEAFQHLPVHETVEIVPAEVKRDPEVYERIGEERKRPTGYLEQRHCW